MGIINVLDIKVANLIAAGEVVERPASAVKELLENSIDAGADKITVEIKNGGVSLIRVSDNGSGMSKDDALVCIKRHATSKIKCENDLDGISTLGFRGEALAAISSVSSMRIMTKARGSDIGYIIRCNAGEIISVDEAGCPDGTTMIIEELFANVPARKKFLKRDASEASAVSAVVEKIALSRSDISIKFIVDGVLRFQTAGDGSLKNVIYSVLGRDFAKRMTKIEDLSEGIKVSGYVGTPENSRGNRNCQNFFINGRYVKCGTASAALEQAYSSYIPSDRFPSCVIMIEINPAFVDVNVHPQKLEVKFSNDRPIFDSVYYAVRNALMWQTKRPEIDGSTVTKEQPDSYRLYKSVIGIKTDNEAEARKIADDRDILNIKYEQLTAYGDKAEPQAEIHKNIEIVTRTEGIRANEETGFVNHTSPSNNRASESEDISAVPEEKQKYDEGTTPLSVPSPASSASSHESIVTEKKTPLPFYKIAGVVFNTYIFVELDEKMLIIDKHAAHERIIFEEMRENMKSGQSSSQLLLFPLEIELTSLEMGAAEEYRDELFKVGFDFISAENGKGAALLQIPSGLDNGQARDMFIEMAERLSSGTGNLGISREQIYEKALYQASCKAAVKGGREDLPENIKWITERVLTENNIRYCPHGRPVAFEMTKAQFEKRFERI